MAENEQLKVLEHARDKFEEMEQKKEEVRKAIRRLQTFQKN